MKLLLFKVNYKKELRMGFEIRKKKKHTKVKKFVKKLKKIYKKVKIVLKKFQKEIKNIQTEIRKKIVEYKVEDKYQKS